MRYQVIVTPFMADAHVMVRWWDQEQFSSESQSKVIEIDALKCDTGSFREVMCYIVDEMRGTLD